ncbi:MAG: TonB-dependent receptor, partial [Pseudomonadota bacterium]
NVVTNKPSDTFEASLRTEFGSYFDFTGEAVVNIPITEKLAIRAVGYGEISDGFVDAPFGDTEDSIGNENAGGRFSVRYTPTDRLTFDASVQVDRTAIDAPLFAIEETLLDGDPAILNGRIDELEIERINVVGEIQYDFDVGLLRSITAFNRTTFEGDEDFDFTPADATLLTRDNSDRAFSQEVRFESAVFSLPSGFGTISANGGFSYADIKGVLAQRFAALGDDPGASVTDAETDITHVSAFGDVRWRPIDQLELAVGARFSRDKVSFDRTVTRFGSFFRDPSISEGDRTFTAITPNASVLFDWTENLSTYFSFSTGFRPGGFVGTSAGPSIEFDEENVRSFEGGLKSTWLDGQLTVNASGYALFYNDIQVPIARAFGGGVENAATARSVGAEITVGTTPVPGLNLQAGLGLAYAKFTDFEESISGDQTGERLPRAPRTSFSFIGDYEHPSPIIADLQPFARVEYSYRSDFSDAVGDTTTLDGYDVTNFRLGVRGERLEVALFVENAFNELYATEAFPGSGFEPDFAPQNLVVPGETRRFGVVTTVRF